MRLERWVSFLLVWLCNGGKHCDVTPLAMLLAETAHFHCYEPFWKDSFYRWSKRKQFGDSILVYFSHILLYYIPVYINIDYPLLAVSAISIRVPQPIFYFTLVNVRNVSVTFVCQFHTKFLVFTCLPCVIPLHLTDPNPHTPQEVCGLLAGHPSTWLFWNCASIWMLSEAVFKAQNALI